MTHAVNGNGLKPSRTEQRINELAWYHAELKFQVQQLIVFIAMQAARPEMEKQMQEQMMSALNNPPTP